MQLENCHARPVSFSVMLYYNLYLTCVVISLVWASIVETMKIYIKKDKKLSIILFKRKI